MERSVLCVVLVVLAVCFEVNAGDPFFRTEPAVSSVVEGNTVGLQCEVSDLQSHHYVQWIKGGIAITFPNRTSNTARLRDIFEIGEPSRYTVTGNFAAGEYKLRIANTLQHEDQGDYRCIVNDDFGPVLLSAVAHLTVTTTPTAMYPLCLPATTRLAYAEGDILNTECTFRNSEPLPQLAWARNNRHVSTGENLYRTLPDTRREWTLSPEDNGAVFTCVATGGALSTSQSCTIGPIVVYYKPQTTVIPEIAEIAAGESITFTCSVTANPQPSTYIWEINGAPLNPASGRYHLSPDRAVLTIIRTIDIDDGLVVRCSAENIVGFSSAASILYVYSTTTQPSRDVVATEKGATPPLSDKFNDPIKETTDKPPLATKNIEGKHEVVVGAESLDTAMLSVPVMAASITGGIIFLIVMVIIIIEFNSWNQKRRKKNREDENRRVSGYYDVNLSTSSQTDECKQRVDDWLSRTRDDKYYHTDKERTFTLKITDSDSIPKIRPFDANECDDSDIGNYVTEQSYHFDRGLSANVLRHHYSEISITESTDTSSAGGHGVGGNPHVYSIPIYDANFYPTVRSPARLVDYGVIDPLG